MGSSLVTAVRRITIRVYSGSETRRKPKYTREGEQGIGAHANSG